MRLIDAVVPHLYLDEQLTEIDGDKVTLSSSALLFIAITIHNIPEGAALSLRFAPKGPQKGARLMMTLDVALG